MDLIASMQDADNLQEINRESITRGIVESCSVLLYLNDETLSSEWCRCVRIIVNHSLCLMIDTRHEVEEARRHGIPIIVLVDTDKQLAREVIDKYMERGYSWLFDLQVQIASSHFQISLYE